MPKGILNGNSKGKRRIEKPKNRWLDEVESDLKTLRSKADGEDSQITEKSGES